MVEAIKEMLKGLAGSKKFAALVAGLLATLLVSKLGLPEEQAADLSTKLVALVASYMIGQGVADHGKEAAKIEAGPLR